MRAGSKRICGSRVSGLDVAGVRVGERWMIGPTVIVKVTSPLEPCATFAARVGGPDERGWVKRFAAARRTGLYVRVVKAGEIVAGDTIEVIEVPADAPTITVLFAGTASPTA